MEAKTGRILGQWRALQNLKTAAWSPDGQYLAVAIGSFYSPPKGPQSPQARPLLRVHHAQTGTVINSFSRRPVVGTDIGVTGVSFAPDGQHLAFGTFNGNAHLLNLRSGQIERHFPSPSAQNLAAPAHYVAYAPDGHTLAVATGDRIMLWRIG